MNIAHMMIALVATALVAGVSVQVISTAGSAAGDRALAEHARELAGVLSSLSGPESRAKVEVTVPRDAVLELVPGYASFQGRLASGAVPAGSSRCSLLLGEGSYTVTLSPETCSSDPAPVSTRLLSYEDWSDGMQGWYSRWAAAGTTQDYTRSGDRALLVSVPSQRRWAGVISSWNNLVRLKPDTVYIAEVYVYVPSSVRLQGKWEFHRHVYDFWKRCSLWTCHHYRILDGDYRFDDSIPRDRWVRKWIKFRTWSGYLGGWWFRAFFVTSYPGGAGTVYWDDFALWEAT